jgi:hypothetical protein
MNILDLERPDVSSIVYDHESERLVDNANADRDFSVLVRCPNVTIERVRGSAFVAHVPQDHFVGMTNILERLFEVINNTPAFSEGEEDIDLFTFVSFVHQSSSGKYRFVLDIDDDPETKSLVYETPHTDGELAEVELANTVGRTADVILHIMVTVDEDGSRACFSAVAEEMRLHEQAVSKKSRKRVPVLIGSK